MEENKKKVDFHLVSCKRWGTPFRFKDFHNRSTRLKKSLKIPSCKLTHPRAGKDIILLTFNLLPSLPHSRRKVRNRNRKCSWYLYIGFRDFVLRSSFWVHKYPLRHRKNEVPRKTLLGSPFLPVSLHWTPGVPGAVRSYGPVGVTEEDPRTHSSKPSVLHNHQRRRRKKGRDRSDPDAFSQNPEPPPCFSHKDGSVGGGRDYFICFVDSDGYVTPSLPRFQSSFWTWVTGTLNATRQKGLESHEPICTLL